MNWFALALAASSLVLTPWGNLDELLRKSDGGKWEGFAAEDPVLLVVQARRFPSRDCAAWQRALSFDNTGHYLGSDPEAPALVAWTPWSSSDRDKVLDCDGFPCKVKLDRAESLAMKAEPESARLHLFDLLVLARARLYLKTQERGPYEYPEPRTNPWSIFESHGFRSEARLPSEPKLWARRLDLGPGKYVIRQIVDRRAATQGKETTVWLRDVYSDHYFDSWGEWDDLRCEGSGDHQQVTLVQALLVEFDLLKKNDIFSRLARGRMRSGVRDQGNRLLDDEFERIRKEAEPVTGRPKEGK